MREETTDDAVLLLHEVEVAVTVPAPDRHPGNEMVEDEIVQDDDSRSPSQGVDDPRVRVGVVPDVVEGDVGRHVPAEAASRALSDDDVDALPERR